ncbi:MAG: hypothetical protein OEV28_10385 [Nitrospirota bacterium]|nr:hypothetical protein [Nitrospirota bacterium]
MAKKEYPIPGTDRKIIVDTSVTPPKITDEKGNPPNIKKMDEVKLLFGDKQATFVSVPEGTSFVTQHNPTCTWVYILGMWYYICY